MTSAGAVPATFTSRLRAVSGTGPPSALSSFLGREGEVAELGALVEQHRLLTLTGPGGAGKTRLAFELAGGLTAGFPDGCHVIELASLRGRDSVGGEMARALGLRAEPDRPIHDTLAEQLQDVQALLVVDNCEHVIDDTRSTLYAVLTRCPDLRVVATSREALGITGEVVWPVTPLDGATAAALFLDRATAARPGFSPRDEDRDAIASIVTHLDGLPLPIELAAARVRMMGPAVIAAGLDDRFRLLTGGSTTAQPRQRTLEASVAWSYDLLDDAERSLARSLSVLSGFTLAAAEDVGTGADLGRDDVLDTLTRLVEKSVVHVDRQRPGGYRLLESMREFLLDRLRESGDEEAVRGRHVDHFLGLAERVGPEVALGDGPEMLAVLEAERDNLDAALDHADRSGRRDDALRLAAALALFWELRGHFTWASRWFSRLLDHDEGDVSLHRGRACWGSAHVAFYSGDIDTMARRAQEALEAAERFDDDWTMARALNIIGFATAVTTPDEATPGLERSIELGQRSGDDWVVLNSSKMITGAAWTAQDEEEAAEPLRILRRRATEHDAAYFLAWYHGVTGSFHAYRGALSEARAELEEGIRLADSFGEPVTGGMSRAWLLRVDVMEGHFDRAGPESAAQLGRANAAGGGLAIPDLLANLGLVSIAAGDASAAVELLVPFWESQHEHGIPFLVSIPALVLASAHRLTGDVDAAETLLGQIATLAEGSGNAWVRACVDRELARCRLDRDELEDAVRLAHAALGVFGPQGRAPDIIETLEVLASAATTSGDMVQAARILGAAATSRSALGLVASPPIAASVDLVRDRLRDGLGDDVDVHWEEGTRLGLDEAMAYTSRARGERRRPDHGWASLTPTELRVAEHVAEGLTNPQIAERMFIARGTVKVHVSHVLAKLELSNRTALATEVIRRRDR